MKKKEVIVIEETILTKKEICELSTLENLDELEVSYSHNCYYLLLIFSQLIN